MPFGIPLIPPLGISCLKAFLKQHGYSRVKAVDVVMESGLKEEYDNYFETLRQALIGNKIIGGNYYYNLGHIVLTNHMMAHLNYKNEEKYIRLVKLLVSKNFYTAIDDGLVRSLIEIIDKFYSRLENYLNRLLEEERPGVLGLSASRDTLPASLFAFRQAKKKYPHIRTIIGGSVFFDQLTPGTAALESFLEKTRDIIDKIIVGEGEILLLKLLQGKLPGEKRVYTIRDIDGELLDLSTAPVPDFSDFELAYYPYLGAYTSRSCPFQCSFCVETVAWGKYRKKSPQRVVSELQQLYRLHGNQLFFMGDSLLNPVITPLSRQLIKSGLSMYWDGYLRADRNVCSTENTMLWRRAGFYRARLGLESGSQRILDLIDKRITVKQSKKAISALAYAGIKTTSFWIVGHPGETEEDFQMTLHLLEELKDNLYEAFCIPFIYHLSGQVKSGEWRKNNTVVPLYPNESTSMLMIQSWIVDTQPSREEIHRRSLRFVQHCKELGIPYPHLFSEVIEADRRWKILHENAVPAQTEFMDRNSYIDENKNVWELAYVPSIPVDEGDFNF